MGDYGYLWPLPLRLIDSLMQSVATPIQYDGWLKQVKDKVMTRAPESCLHTAVGSSDIIKDWHLEKEKNLRLYVIYIGYYCSICLNSELLQLSSSSDTFKILSETFFFYTW